ncbi:MAG: hypothetical protein MJZ19_04765 [Paludibacteraceae bacterium]|nr:hypothetical protein [Paludibacteraceae bacterium]
MNKKFDADFVKVAGLSWIPWVGDNYENASCKVLLVGESVYATNDNDDTLEHYDEINSNPDYVRERNVKWWANDEKNVNPRPFPKNTMDLLCRENAQLDKNSFWNGVAFTELIQVAMSNSSDRPASAQREAGLVALFETIDILKPDYVLFLHNESLEDKYMRKVAKTLNLDFSECQWIESNNVRNHMRFSTYKQYKLIAVPHPSRVMTSDKLRSDWYEELKRCYPDMINYFNSL